MSGGRPRWWWKVEPPHAPRCMSLSRPQPCPVGAKALCAHGLLAHGRPAQGSVLPYICQSRNCQSDRSRHNPLQRQTAQLRAHASAHLTAPMRAQLLPSAMPCPIIAPNYCGRRRCSVGPPLHDHISCHDTPPCPVSTKAMATWHARPWAPSSGSTPSPIYAKVEIVGLTGTTTIICRNICAQQCLSKSS